MAAFELAVALFLLLNVAAGLVRIHRGPTAVDRMLAAQLIGTTLVAVALLLAQALRMPAARDVALVLTVLAAMAMLTFITRGWQDT